jgi:hypothetical protein
MNRAAIAATTSRLTTDRVEKILSQVEQEKEAGCTISPLDHIETKTTSGVQCVSRGNYQLLMNYRKALIYAYDLGENIKELYGIVPPTVLFDRSTRGHLGIANLKLCVATNVRTEDQH